MFPSAGPHLEERPTELSPEKSQHPPCRQEGVGIGGHVYSQTLHTGCVLGTAGWTWEWRWNDSLTLSSGRGKEDRAGPQQKPEDLEGSRGQAVLLQSWGSGRH